MLIPYMPLQMIQSFKPLFVIGTAESVTKDVPLLRMTRHVLFDVFLEHECLVADAAQLVPFRLVVVPGVVVQCGLRFEVLFTTGVRAGERSNGARATLACGIVLALTFVVGR